MNQHFCRILCLALLVAALYGSIARLPLRTFYPMDDYLRYEKDLLRHWFGGEFSKLKSQNMSQLFEGYRFMKVLHKIIFWTHLLAGVVAGLVIFIMSFTGVILMYEPQIAEYSEWNQRRVMPPAPAVKRLALGDLVAKVRAANPEGRPAAITVKSDPAASVIVNLSRENTVSVNSYTGELLGDLSATHHFMHEIVDWHRWLGTEGEGRATGKAITGACNLAFFWLALTGVYLWWPHSWKWRGLKTSLLFNLRLTGKARDWNWHNVIGFWSSSVLVVLTGYTREGRRASRPHKNAPGFCRLG